VPASSTSHVRKSSRYVSSRRRGAVVVLAAFLMVGLLLMIAFAVDIGYVALNRTELQTAADSAALAGAGALPMGRPAATAEAIKFLAMNKVGQRTMVASNATIDFGTWDFVTRTFKVSAAEPYAVRVRAVNNAQPLYFGRVIGKNTFNSKAEAVATFQPRDISLVLDYSASMCYDSQFRNIHLLGKPAIEANLLQIYQQLGSPKYGTLAFKPVKYGSSSTSNTTVIKQFQLDKVPYPFPSGSWSDYVDYVQTDDIVASAGYQNAYGYMTWVNYTLARRPESASSPGLWRVSEQPITALKDAVDVFLSYLTAHSTDDRVSLSIYTHSDRTAILESALTKKYSTVADLVRGRQAGHYISTTNISAGMNKGRLDLEKNGRSGAKKMMVLMTDGVVNMPTGNTTTDKALVIQEAKACAAANIPIITIALGAYADTALMQQCSDLTKGAAFIVEGGQPIAEVEEQLEEIFGKVAADRPIKLVQ